MRVRFDPRLPHAWLLVEGALGKQHATFVLDTGIGEHLVSPALAAAAHVKRGAAHNGMDVHGQTRVLQRIVGALDVPGVVAPVAPLFACDLTELADVGDSRVGGVLCPQDLVTGDDALRIDIPRGRMEQVSSGDAFSTSSDRALLLADVTRDGSGDFLVTAHVEEREVVLVADTGAPTSALFLAPGGTEGTFGTSQKRAHLELGRVRRELLFDVIEPMVDAGTGGLLGLDLLRDCTLAISTQRLRITCDDKLDVGVAAAPPAERTQRFAPYSPGAADVPWRAHLRPGCAPRRRRGDRAGVGAEQGRGSTGFARRGGAAAPPTVG